MALASFFSPILRKDSWAAMASVLFVSASALTIFLWHHDRYYGSNSYNFAINKQRDYATAINALPPGTQLVFCSESLRNAAGWYLDLMSSNAISAPVLTAESSPVNVAFVVNEGSCASYSADESELTAKMGPSSKTIDAGDIRIYQWALNPTSSIHVDKTPTVFDLPPAPEEFFKNVHELDKVAVNMDWEGRILPTDNLVDSSFSYEFSNASSGRGRQVTIGMNYLNRGKNNLLKLSYKFDNELSQDAFVLTGPESSTHRQVVIDRKLPFKRLNVKVTMNCSKETPEYPGNNLASIGVGNVRVAFGAEEQSSAPVQIRLIEPERLPGDFQARGFGDIGHTAGKHYRWGFGPESCLSFSLPDESPVVVSMDYINFIPGQVVEIFANNTPVGVLDLQEYAAFDASPKHSAVGFMGKKGVNTITLRYKFWNLNSLLGKPARYLEKSDELAALHFTDFTITVDAFNKSQGTQ